MGSEVLEAKVLAASIRLFSFLRETYPLEKANALWHALAAQK